MHSEAKSHVPWDLADKKTQKNRFSSASFYVLVDGITSVSVRAACSAIKSYFTSYEGVRVRGPKSMPTERRRYMVMREMRKDETCKGVYLTRPLRYRSVLLVTHPTSGCVSGLIGLILPSDVNIKIERYDNQFNLREDR